MSPERSVPDKPSLEGLEARWGEEWEREGTYRFDRTKTRDQIYSVDTPPPTVSGSLHVGHVFSFTHTDTIVRYQRMRGRECFYPMGWDDNGVPTERRVENFYGVRCDPSLPYDPDFRPPAEPPKGNRRDDLVRCSRRNFIDLCFGLTAEDEQAFEELWRHLGLSVDWSLTYTTINDQSRRASQRAFLRNLARGEAYQSEAPTLWDVRFEMAVSQAELEDREQPGAYHQVAFGRDGGDPVVIDTTRPELIPACVALVAHPDDERYQPFFETQVRTPLFGVPVPVKAHRLADPEKGTGIAMICTFGDTTDVTWWRELDLPVRAVVGRNGRLLPDRAPRVHRRGHRPLRVRARRQDPVQRQGAHRRAAGRGRSAAGRAPQDHPPGQVLREGRQAPRDRHLPSVVHPQRRAGGRPAAGPHRPGQGARLAPRLHAGEVRGLDRGPQRRLADQPPALLRRAHPGLVRRRGRRRGRPRHRARARRGRPPRRSDLRGASRLRRGPARPTGRLRGGGRHHGHLGHVLALPAGRGRVGRRRRPVPAGLPDGPAPPGPRHHPHLAVLHRGAVPLRARHRSLAARRHLRLDPRPGPQEDVEVQGQRGDADGHARPVRIRRRALLVRQRPAGHRHRTGRGPDEGRATPGHQGPQRQQVRAEAG